MTIAGKLIRVGAGLLTGNANAVGDILKNDPKAIANTQKAIGIAETEQNLFGKPKVKEEELPQKVQESIIEMLKKYWYVVVGVVGVIAYALNMPRRSRFAR